MELLIMSFSTPSSYFILLVQISPSASCSPTLSVRVPCSWQTLPVSCTGLIQLISYSNKYMNITNTNLITFINTSYMQYVNYAHPVFTHYTPESSKIPTSYHVNLNSGDNTSINRFGFGRTVFVW
jgi:hypothetical protein